MSTIRQALGIDNDSTSVIYALSSMGVDEATADAHMHAALMRRWNGATV